jgi:hypothetical protein
LQGVKENILKTGFKNDTTHSFIYHHHNTGSAMAILDNFENWIFQDELPFETKPENDSLAMKIFSDTCCHGCYCQSEKDHKQESR